MKMPLLPRRQLAAIALLACTAAWSPLASAQTPPTPIVVVDSTGWDYYSTYDVSATEWRGPAFTTGAEPVYISEITLGLSNGDPSVQAIVQLYLLDDTTELPTGAALGTASLPVVVPNDDANLNPNTYTAAQLGSIAGTLLQPHKKYALIVSNTSGGTLALSDYNGLSDTSYTFAGGFSIAADGYLHTPDSGSTWEKLGLVTPGFRLTVVPESVPPVIVDPVLPPAAPTPVPSLGILGLVSLASALGLLGLRRSRKKA